MVKTLSNLPKLERFCLCCGKGYDFSRIAECMDAVFSQNVKIFEVYMLNHGGVDGNHSLVVLPCNLFDCTSLEKLVLALPCIYKAPIYSYFQNLKELKLRHAQILNPNTNSVLIVLPILEQFELFSCQWRNVNSFGILASKLIDFLSEPEGDPCNEYSITIIRAMVKHFTIRGGFVENIKLTASTVVHARLLCSFNYMGNTDALIEDGIHTRVLLGECSSIRDLEIEGFILEAIAKSHIDVEGLLELLHATPNLKILTLYNTDVWSYYDFNVPVPSCVISCLEKVIFDDRGATAPLCSLSKFFDENGSVLKTLSFSRYDQSKVKEILERL